MGPTGSGFGIKVEAKDHSDDERLRAAQPLDAERKFGSGQIAVPTGFEPVPPP